ncbi:DNA phosphorothioation-dependent restriction protein DptH [Sediminibacillus massiliensis]|uniref:DNA phosphorothioation-dependent restriction protein DptH n=1 Tax=Sediminibacillus massiliensis TaxID=1926277 RepID=UPI00098890EA|nr:DNA phosphorothioation-dependent restriction protein DptH [Sediminibacillus massiliensis]
MSNQFYNYIASLLLDYFNKIGIKSGDRFYLQLDNASDVHQLIEAMRNMENTTPFSYKHDLGERYDTFAIKFNEHKLVVAFTSENVKPDFLVTLRNLVGEQEGDWENTSLISIVSEQLDSIQGGSSDLQKEGMPLHPESLFNSLKKEIENSQLEKVDQIILFDNLSNLMKEQPFQQITLFEFEDIFSTLQKGGIEDNEYYKFGLFKDPDLASFPGNEQQKRINLNRELFSFVKKVHEYGLDKEDLENQFSPRGAGVLEKEDWQETDFPKVNQFHEEYKKLNKRLKVELESLTIKDKLTYWDKPLNENAAGKRKRHIVIFNPDNLEEIELTTSFLLSGNISGLNQDYLTVEKQLQDQVDIQVKKKNIVAKLQTQKNEVSFVKFSYKHDKKAALGAEFFIAILPMDPIQLDNYKAKYLVNTKKKAIEINFEEDELNFGDGLNHKREEISEQNQEVTFTQDDKLTIVPLPEAFNDNDELYLRVRFFDTSIPFLFRNELPDSMPISGQRIWRLIREKGKDFQWIKENNRLVLENQEFYFHAEYRGFFEWEDEMVEYGMRAGQFSSDQLNPIEISLGENLREAYSRFINYFKTHDSIPSLSTVTEDFKRRAIEYINEYQKEIDSFEEGVAAGKRGLDLFKLGTIRTNENIYLTPFHPLMVAYKIKYFELLGQEELDNSIINRLSPDALVPFIYDENEMLYKPDHQLSAAEWLVLKPVNQVSISDANQYLAKVVNDKIAQFKMHFSYLFIEKSQAPLQISVINISNDLEVLRGILQWMLGVIDKQGPDVLKPIEVTLYKNKYLESSFDLYARTETVSEFENIFNIKLKAKELDSEDVLRIIREKLFFFKREPGAEYRYAHISFYKMDAQEKKAVQSMKDMKSGIAIEGLYSSVPSMKDAENYRSGFGTKSYSIDNSNILTSTSYYVNELATNLRNGGNDSYRKGEGIYSRTTNTDEETLEKIFQSSYWVTFVDPTVDLEYFNKYDGNLVVIHYSDQYSSSSRYDAITVTDKSDQYFAVIKEFLKQKDVEGTDENVLNTIKAFNTFNGEWLLRIIGSNGHLDREKLSIISAIKYSVSYLDHPNILWIPISLEEVLRVAGAVSLNKSDGVFTAKNLGVKGSHSDDLLLIGIETDQNKDELSLHFYPVEVKIGINNSTVLDKARDQVRKTKSLLLDTLTGEVGDTFKGKFYRNFFSQLVISNAQKLDQSEFWNEKNYHLSDEIVEKLLKDQYTVSNELQKFAGDGAILSFQKDAYHRSAAQDEDILLINLTEYDGYKGLVYPISAMRHWVQEKPNDFIKEDMLSYKYKAVSEVVNGDSSDINEETKTEKGSETKEIQPEAKSDSEEENNLSENPTGFSSEESEETEEEHEQPTSNNENNKNEEVEVIHKPALEDTRILLGKAENSNRELYWEYGNKGLANRHLLISGKSGQGKTYFMQCLLLEKAKLGIPSIVIDYTEGFLPNQLEPEFVEFLGDKVKQKIVYSEKFPVNPFAKNVRDIGGIELPESDTDVAERIKSVFSSVYSTLGIQQQNAIYDATLKGLELYNEEMNLEKLKELLEEEGSNYSKTALSQIRPFIDRNPFSHTDTINWKDIIESNGEVFIIQLTGFPRDVQLIITEFILWDLWNYSVRFGNKNNPMPVIMDEAQNLDHTEKSPSARILTEGRKFGWSAWYATQFLKSQLSADELARLQNSSQKIYFSPPEQELSNIASSLSKDNQERRQWENRLAGLKKGQCIVHGPILKPNGELSNPTITVVDITALSERI